MSEVETISLVLDMLPDDAIEYRAAIARTVSDEQGFFKKRILSDGRMLGVVIQFYNFKLTLSDSEQDPGWRDAW